MTFTFKTVSEFSPYEDASGALMSMSHPLCGTMHFNFVNGKVSRSGEGRVKCFGNRAAGKFRWAADKLQTEYQARIDALGPEWMTKHKELYEIE